MLPSGCRTARSPLLKYPPRNALRVAVSSLKYCATDISCGGMRQEACVRTWTHFLHDDVAAHNDLAHALRIERDVHNLVVLPLLHNAHLHGPLSTTRRASSSHAPRRPWRTHVPAVQRAYSSLLRSAPPMRAGGNCASSDHTSGSFSAQFPTCREVDLPRCLRQYAATGQQTNGTHVRPYTCTVAMLSFSRPAMSAAVGAEPAIIAVHVLSSRRASGALISPICTCTRSMLIPGMLDIETHLYGGCAAVVRDACAQKVVPDVRIID